MSFQPQLVLEPFDKLALDFVGPINISSHHKSYILVCTDYFKNWMESKALLVTTEKAVVGFIHEEIFTRFGIPREIVIDGGTQLTSRLIKCLMDRYNIKHKVTIRYHPRAHGKVEGANKIL
jgi:hypothetical protein